MSVLKPRNRLVYFRVSEDEFRELNHFRESMGVRSISDLARSAMQRLLKEGYQERSDAVSQRLIALETVVADLRQKVEKMTMSPESSRIGSVRFAGLGIELQDEPAED
jgi:hypothetical protein